MRTLLPLCPPDVRIAAWVKPFASFKRGVTPAYAWEPVIYKPCRSRTDRFIVRDFVSENITLKRGLCGLKPDRFCYWNWKRGNCWSRPSRPTRRPCKRR